MGGTNDPPERNDDQDDDLKAGEEVRANPSLNSRLKAIIFIIFRRTSQLSRREVRVFGLDIF
jgi:hypothetical protein